MYLFNCSVSDIVLAAGADRTIQVFDMNQGCMATQIPDAHCRAVHHLTQNIVREWDHIMSARLFLALLK